MARTLIPLLIILFLCCCYASVVEASKKASRKYMNYKDATLPVEVRIQDLLKRMTLAEKIGQMAQVERENMTAHIVKKYRIGSMFGGGGSAPAPKASPKQ
ncbi:hypothetical protein SLE2022_326720 [Rubroshorea leprosula]